MYEDLTNKSYEYAMEYFQRHFQNSVYEIFGKDNVAMAFLFGSVVRGYSSYKPGHNTDLDMFVCMYDDIPDKEQKVNAFRKWYKEFHIEHGLKPDDEWPGEIMTVSELDEALNRQDDIRLKLHHNSAKTLDTVAWAPMIIEPSLEKLGNPDEIKRYQDWCTYSKTWIQQVMNILDDKMPLQEMFHRTGRFITPWLKGLIQTLEEKVDLQYSSQRGYYCPSHISQKNLYDVLSSYSEANPIRTINDPVELRKLKYTIIADHLNDIDIKSAAVFLSNPGFLLEDVRDYPKYKKPVSIFSDVSASYITRESGSIPQSSSQSNDNDDLSLLPIHWKKEIITDLVKSHPNDIASYTIRGIIDWYHLEDYREFEIFIPPERCSFAQKKSKLTQIFNRNSNVDDFVKCNTLRLSEKDDSRSENILFSGQGAKGNSVPFAKIDLSFPDLTFEEWEEIKSGRHDTYAFQDHISTACVIIENLTNESIESMAANGTLRDIVTDIQSRIPDIQLVGELEDDADTLSVVSNG